MKSMLEHTAPASPHRIEPVILEQAADWLTLLRSGEATAKDWAQLERWRHQSDMHVAAWQRAESVMGTFSQVPVPVARGTLSRMENVPRRRALKTFALLLIAAPSAWVAWQQQQHWRADLRTAIGEQQSFDLADGSRLVLNTATTLDVTFSDNERRLTLLQGEILITTAKDSAPASRPFLVDTAQGQLRALGTRFSVHQLDGQTRLAVYQGAVEITLKDAIDNAHQNVVVAAGEQRMFSRTHLFPPEPAANNEALWQRGMLLAREMPLKQLIAELSRYRRGILRCDPAVASLQVSGAFPVNDTDASLTLLQQTLPVQVSRIGPWWVTVSAADN